MNRQVAFSLLVFLFVIIGTITVILVGKGYRLGTSTGRLEIAGTGLLVLKSTPDTAQVFVNGHLTTATNNTINLSPGEYDIKIAKEGYFPWEKKINIQAEVVSQAQALLLPTAPKLESISNYGASNPAADPSLSRIAYTVSSQSAQKNGIYIIDTSVRPILTLQNASSQIADDTTIPFSKAKLTWSPDGKEILASISATIGTPTVYLLKTDQLNTAPSDVTEILPTVMANWKKEQDQINQSRLNSAPQVLRNVIKNDFEVLSWSPDETKILYKASTSATIPVIVKPRLIGANSTPEARDIKKNDLYVYDIKEDRNFPVSSALEKVYAWLPDSGHFVYVNDNKVDVVEYDGQNNTEFYAGPFNTNYVFPWSDGTRIIILTNLGNSSISANLYTISLK